MASPRVSKRAAQQAALANKKEEGIFANPNRLVYMFGDVNSDLAEITINQLVELSYAAPEEPIILCINSEGGSIYDMWAIHDTMTSIAAPVWTHAIGAAMSAASFILSAGAPGHRSCTSNTCVMIHELSMDIGEQKLSNVRKEYEASSKLSDQFVAKFANYVNKTGERVRADLETGGDRYMTAMEARDYGVVDKVY